MDEKIVVIGLGHASVIAAQHIKEVSEKSVIIVDNQFSNPLPIKSFHIPGLIKPMEPNNRRTRRSKIKQNKKKK